MQPLWTKETYKKQILPSQLLFDRVPYFLGVSSFIFNDFPSKQSICQVKHYLTTLKGSLGRDFVPPYCKTFIFPFNYSSDGLIVLQQNYYTFILRNCLAFWILFFFFFFRAGLGFWLISNCTKQLVRHRIVTLQKFQSLSVKFHGFIFKAKLLWLFCCNIF